jgi:hypothetical protein
MGEALLVPVYESLSTELYVSEFARTEFWYMFRKVAGETVLFVYVGTQMEP